jgi:hypothetical protein
MFEDSVTSFLIGVAADAAVQASTATSRAMDATVAYLNIAHFKTLLAPETSCQAADYRCLLAEEEAKLTHAIIKTRNNG